MSAQRITAARDIDALIECALDCLRTQFDIHHALVLINDVGNGRLYTVASMGYEQSGVGSEIPLGHGVVGVAARERAAIRIGHATSEYAYGRAMREAAAAAGLALETEIPLPGLAQSRSQMAVPIEAFGRLIGALFVDSDRDMRFCYDDEDALVLGCRRGTSLGPSDDGVITARATRAARAAPGGADVRIRRHPRGRACQRRVAALVTRRSPRCRPERRSGMRYLLAMAAMLVGACATTSMTTPGRTRPSRARR